MAMSKTAGKRTWFENIRDSPVPWLLPLAIVLGVTFLFPVFEIARLSFTDANMLQATAVFVFASVFLQMLLGFLIALLVDQGEKRGMRTSIATRTAVLSAWAIPGVIIGIIWSILYEQSAAGILNYVLGSIGLSVPFLSDPQVALASVTVANIWRGTAFSMILLYAGLQTLPEDVMEAARVDGANAWQRLTRIVLPLLAPILLINLIVVSIETFNTFDMVLALTGGGPGRSTEVVALSIYNQIFQQFDLGQGAATAVLLLTINLLMTFVYVGFLERKEEVG